MQVYALLKQGNNILIAKKAVTNSRFQGPDNPNGIVNQAGQWALPGGKKNFNETPDQAAMRELEEETGINFYRKATTTVLPNIGPNKNKYTLVVLELHGEYGIQVVAGNINDNISLII